MAPCWVGWPLGCHRRLPSFMGWQPSLRGSVRRALCACEIWGRRESVTQQLLELEIQTTVFLKSLRGHGPNKVPLSWPCLPGSLRWASCQWTPWGLGGGPSTGRCPRAAVGRPHACEQSRALTPGAAAGTRGRTPGKGGGRPWTFGRPGQPCWAPTLQLVFCFGDPASLPWAELAAPSSAHRLGTAHTSVNLALWLCQCCSLTCSLLF